jgi:hypothetical protein
MRLALAALLLVGLSLPLAAEPDKAPDIKQIMQRANKPTGIYFNLKKDLEDEEPMWADMREEARELAQLAASLGKQTPPKGDRASWMKLTRAYADDARGLYQAIGRKDRRVARSAIARLGGDTCTRCHKAHRPE